MIYPYFMFTNFDTSLLLSLQVLALKKICPILKKCDLQVDPAAGELTIISYTQVIASLLEWKQEYIAAITWLKLGCKQINFYLNSHRFAVYNLSDVFAAIENILVPMLTVDRPDTQVQSQSQSTNSNWISFDAIANTLSGKLGIEVSSDEIESSVEQFKIPALRQDGEWGLDRKSLPQYIDRYFTSFKDAVVAEMIPPSTTRRTGTRRKSATAATPNNVTPIGAAANAAPTPKVEAPSVEGEMTLPMDFAEILMRGRQRKPDIKTGLKLSLSLLPDGKEDQDNYLTYLRSVADTDPKAQGFIKDLAQHFTSSSRNSNKAQKEIADAAVVLIRERNQKAA